ncbi:MAG TPA: hypothetical protein VF062_04375 [Candidatus Limnocylindrales bacterium]
MAYVGLDVSGVRNLAKVLQDIATRTETVRLETIDALRLADLSSQVPTHLASVQDGISRLATGVSDKAELAEQATMDPQRIAAGMGVTAEQLQVAIKELIGFGGPADLRAVLLGLAPPGAGPALDAALARLSPAILPALMAGQRPELAPAQDTLSGGAGDDRLIGEGEATLIVLAAGGPSLLDRYPNNLPDLGVPDDSALDKDGRPIDNWFGEGFGGISTESLRAQAEQLGIHAETQRTDARRLEAIQQSAQLLGPPIGGTLLGVWGAAEGAFKGSRFGPYGALVNGTIGLVVGFRKGWQAGGPIGQALGTGMFNVSIRDLKLGANQSEAMQQIINSEIYRREVEERFAYQTSVEQLAPQGTALSFGGYDPIEARALDGTVIPQPTLMPSGIMLPDGSMMPEEGAALDSLDGAPDLMRISVDLAAESLSPYGSFEALPIPESIPEFSFQDFVPYYEDLEPTYDYNYNYDYDYDYGDFSDVEMFSFDESSTFDTGDFVYE